MSRPIVAIVGRPNVGKSTLVNRIAQTSDAIVHQSRGVTRDRSYHVADWNGREFMLVDTGGIEPMKSDDVFATSIRDQALAAAEEAAVILFVVDGSVGVTEEDESVARMVRKLKKPTFLLVNKLDNPARENDSLWEFYSLGVGDPVASPPCTAMAPATCSTKSSPCCPRTRATRTTSPIRCASPSSADRMPASPRSSTR